MNTHRYDQVNPLTNPVMADDCVISETGERYFVRESIAGYWIQHADGACITHPIGHDQMAICRVIDQLADL